MTNMISIKGLFNRGDLSNKTLQNMYTHTATGSIISNLDIEELFEVTIYANLISSSSVVFQDMNLNVFNCKITFKVIGIDKLNMGVFLNYDYNCVITYKSFKPIPSCNLLVLDSYFYKGSNLNIDFSLVIALDFSKEYSTNISLINPLSTENFSSPEISLLFDKEFI